MKPREAASGAAVRRARTRRGADRRSDILDAARALFLKRGYFGTTTDSVVAVSGGSKETIYAHFGDKAGLFRAVAEREIGLMLDTVAEDEPEDRPIRDILRGSGRRFVARLMREDSLRLARIFIAESERLPEFGEQIYDGLRSRFLQQVAASLHRHPDAKLFRDGEPEYYAGIFLDLLVEPTIHRALLVYTYRPSEDALDLLVERAVDAVMRLGGGAASTAG